jgi:phenylacetate-CoA ligase
MLERIYRHLLIPAYESGMKGRKSFAYWKELEASQWLATEEIRSRQLASLQKLIAHASAHCPFYRDQWKLRGLGPGDVQSLADFEAWPFTDRDTVRRERLAMRDTRAGVRLIHKATGGSSGVPLTFDHDTESYERRFAAWYRGYGWAGGPPGTRQWYLWGGATGEASRSQKFKTWLYNSLYRRSVANCFELSDASVPRFLERLNACRPDNIVAYTNPLFAFARALKERGLQPFAPRSIIVGAEKLHDFQRALIEEVFRAPVFETYGSREFMLIGGECERHAGLHLTMENLLVEIVDDDGRPTPGGDEGNVVVTDLTNYGMPFIRYLNGDRAVAGFDQCPCGRGLPLLRKVVGRRLDMLETPDGRLVPGEFFPHLIKDFAPIRRFQVVQEDSQAIELRLVVDDHWNESARQALERQVRPVVGAAVRFEITLVDDIPLTPAGKLQVVVRRPRDTDRVFGGSV